MVCFKKSQNLDSNVLPFWQQFVSTIGFSTANFLLFISGFAWFLIVLYPEIPIVYAQFWTSNVNHLWQTVGEKTFVVEIISEVWFRYLLLLYLVSMSVKLYAVHFKISCYIRQNSFHPVSETSLWSFIRKWVTTPTTYPPTKCNHTRCSISSSP